MPWDQDPTLEPREYRIYGDDRASEWCVVDEIDYQWAIQWKWRFKRSGKKSKKKYLCRNVHERLYDGPAKESRVQRNLFLHVAIMERTGKRPPTPLHNIVDHIDGDEFNCRRGNLGYVTKLENGRKKKRVKS